MKNQWTIWALAGCVIVAILFIVNYQGKKDTTSMGEIFPEEESKSPDIQYEFVGKDGETAQEKTAAVERSTETEAPAATRTEKSAAATQPAAQNTQLAMTSKPITLIIPQVPAPEKNTGTESQPNLAPIPFTIQVSSFKDKTKAELELAGLKAAGHSAYISEVDLKEKGTWYRIYVGNFATKSQADEFLSKLKPTYKDSFVISPKKKLD